MADEEISLSIEETNKLRISLGLKPLSVDNEPKKQSAEENFEKYNNELKKNEETKKIQEKIQKSRVKRELKKKLTGKGLGELDDEENDDALSWIKRQKKRQKEIAEMKRKELEAMDNEVLEEYKSENLKGLKVGHNISEIETGEEEILVLKDAVITEDDNVEDELTSIRLTEKEKLQKNLELKKKKTIYGGVYDDEEALYGKKKILSQYDEDDESKGFILNGNGEVFDTSLRNEEDNNGFKKGSLDLNYNKMQEIKDYYTKDEMVSFKKPKKKKKKKHTKKIRLDGEESFIDSENSMNVGNSSQSIEVKQIEKYSYSNINSNIDDINFIDDDELQTALSKARRKNTKKLVKSIRETVEEVKQEDIKEKKKEEEENKDNDEDNNISFDLKRKEESEGIRFINEVSETSEFIRNIPTLPLLQRQNPNEKPSNINNEVKKEDNMEMESVNESNNEESKISDQNEQELEEGERPESEDESTELKSNEQSSNKGVAALEEEPLISSGMAATVSLLLQKGIVNPVTKEELEKERLQIEKEKWLNEQKLNDLIKERRRQKDDRRDRHRSSRDRDRDYDRDDIYRERERAREAEKKFKNYKPVVNIEYHDEFGRTLTQKEAFRQLSHKFHGKTSGKLKTEKRLKKLEEELKLKQMSSTDTPLGTVSALQERTKAMGSAHLVLSIGNRGVLPSENDVAGLQPRTDIKKKSKESENNESIGTSSIQQSTFITTLNNPGTANAPKREKIAFGLKRKAEQEINPVFKKRE
ncbi:SART-1 protein [Piromyces finnis]|uniref:SART-1 protein n=1 Tax=Piromyces finnis TaxID=1754191 RepID=A0A1Y1VN82_9FUNG|nr:SART-1 protein [Piromyces finnis]|eukprot:ORX60071.1 SART-1 protein [Piromyces finnis]